MESRNNKGEPYPAGAETVKGPSLQPRQKSNSGKSVTKRVFRFFWEWQDTLEEQWLSKMERDGWRLTNVKGPFYTFVEAEPADAAYRSDYRELNETEVEEYFGLFADAGWEHVTSYSHLHYFRCLTEAVDFPEIYSDSDSLIDKHRRRARRTLFAIVPYLPIWVTVMSRPIPSGKGPFLTGLYTVGKWGYVLLVAMAGYWLLRVYRLIRSV